MSREAVWRLVKRWTEAAGIGERVGVEPKGSEVPLRPGSTWMPLTHPLRPRTAPSAM